MWFYAYVVVAHPDPVELARARNAFLAKSLFREFSLIPAGVDVDEWCRWNNPFRDGFNRLLTDVPGREFSFQAVTKNTPPTELYKTMHEQGFEVTAWNVCEGFEIFTRFAGGELVVDACDEDTFLQHDAWKDPRAVVAVAAQQHVYA